MALLTLVISSPGSDCIKWERKLKKGGARCKHRPPPKMTHQQDLTKSRLNYHIKHLAPFPGAFFVCKKPRHQEGSGESKVYSFTWACLTVTIVVAKIKSSAPQITWALMVMGKKK